MNEHEYDGIDYHSDNGERHAACNVKFYGGQFVNLAEEQAMEDFGEGAYNMVQAFFWEDAIELAHEAGYSCVFAEGRSDGWLVPFYQVGMTQSEREKRNLTGGYVGDFYQSIPHFDSWPGQGPELGYPRYPDMDNVDERSRFRTFAKKIEGMMASVPQMIQDEAELLAEEAVASFS